MATEIKVPTLGESVTEATVAKWFKKVGDTVEADEPLLELETDKVTLEVPAPKAGVLTEIVAEEGAEVEVGAVLGKIGEAGEAASAPAAAPAEEKPAETSPPPPAADTAPPPPPPAPAETSPPPAAANDAGGSGDASAELSPAVRKLVAENDVDPASIEGTGKDGRLTKGDVLEHVSGEAPAAAEEPQAEEVQSEEAPTPEPKTESAPPPQQIKTEETPAEPKKAGDREERVRMSRLRRRIAERLKEAQNTAAMLTTFNDVDMSGILDLRARYKEAFEKKHGVRLGFMSFFVKASIAALKEIPAVNAEIDGDEIVYKNHYDIGVAVGTEQGLVVPVLRDADAMSFAEIEQTITELGHKARDGKLSMDDLTGGTFTVSNGGVYGSLLSTPILNPPQSGILGMHRTEKRPVAIGDKVEIRPMMYLAMSYDHRIVDGREAVTFLKRIKECLEDPERMLLDM